jgi:hypothetical protein
MGALHGTAILGTEKCNKKTAGNSSIYAGFRLFFTIQYLRSKTLRVKKLGS